MLSHSGNSYVSQDMVLPYSSASEIPHYFSSICVPKEEQALCGDDFIDFWNLWFFFFFCISVVLLDGYRIECQFCHTLFYLFFFCRIL
jgi:hypothetical protein